MEGELPPFSLVSWPSQVLVALAALNYNFFCISSPMKKALLAFLPLDSCTHPLPRIHKCLKPQLPWQLTNAFIKIFLKSSFSSYSQQEFWSASICSHHSQEQKSTFFIITGEDKILIMEPQTITKEGEGSEEEDKSRAYSFEKVKKGI